jgi:hypothetical protein
MVAKTKAYLAMFNRDITIEEYEALNYVEKLSFAAAHYERWKELLKEELLKNIKETKVGKK